MCEICIVISHIFISNDKNCNFIVIIWYYIDSVLLEKKNKSFREKLFDRESSVKVPQNAKDTDVMDVRFTAKPIRSVQYTTWVSLEWISSMESG